MGADQARTALNGRPDPSTDHSCGPNPSTGRRIAVIGGSGFIGRAIVAAIAQRDGFEAIVVPRIPLPDRADPDADAVGLGRAWLCEHPLEVADLTRRLVGVDAIINAAGRAEPDERVDAAIWGSNVVLPIIAALVADGAGVPRMVHISTAAVQGLADPLDETSLRAPFSPYSRSKAVAEVALARLGPELRCRIVVHRPASVLGAGRPATDRLVRRLQGRFVPVAAGPDRPLPIALVENVADLAVILATADDVPEVITQPAEGITVRNLVALVGSPRTRVVVVPRLAARVVRAAIGVLPSRAGPLRRLLLLLDGQSVRSTAGSRLGYRPSIGHEGYRTLRAPASINP